MGKVYLIGTGPGDEELLTLKAVRVLKKCTAVLYDRLGAGNIFKYLREDCRIYYCGKEPGCHYKTQEEINDMLVALARDGHIVGRVKGGDPYVFGRGGEEALRLCNEKIEFEVVPGITSPISVLSYAGIPITHRGLSQSFHVYTGKSSKELNIDWKSAVKSKGTLVFLMGLENIENIVQSLKENSMEESTPAAVIMRGTTSKQKKVIGNLGNICERVKSAGLKSPCIIVVGKVVELNPYLEWYEKKPFFGLNICVTRSKEQSKDICEKLLELGAEVTELNSIKFINTDYNMDKYIERLEEYDYLAFTSVNSVNIFFDYLKKVKYDIRRIRAKLAAIGNATGKCLEDRGLIVDIRAEECTAEGLLKELGKYVNSGDKLLLPCSKDGREVLSQGLLKLNTEVHRVHTYEVAEGEIKNIYAFDAADIVMFTSPSIVKNMLKLVGYEKIKKKLCLAIGPITAEELKNNNLECIVCDEYSTEGIIKKIWSVKNE